ncbi:MAG: hypothetical protein HUU57_16610 [Bdellovibrio sp.]|nr:hypothetical protein [Bdellovibrio sp.]
MVLSKKSVFLLDGMGAAASALFTGLVLPYFTSEIGLPIEILYPLATLPILCSMYSFACHFSKRFYPWMLAGIIAANIFYCLISAALMAVYEAITPWGVAVLTAEIVIVLVVVYLEIKVYRQDS